MALYQQYDGASGGMTWYDTESGMPVVWTPPGQSVTGGSGNTWSATNNPASQAMSGLSAELASSPMINLSGAVGPSANAPWYSMGGKYYVPLLDYGLDPTSGMPTIAESGFEVGNGAFKFPTYSGGRKVRLSGGPSNALYGIELDTQPGVRDWQRSPEGSFFGDVLGNFVSGPGVPLGGFIGAGAFNSGGLGNFLNSFGGGGATGVGVGGGAGGLSGGEMFDPFADFGADYFSGASDFTGGGLSPSDFADIDSWLSNEGNFANDILGTGPRLPNGTPVDLFLANTAKNFGLSPSSLASIFKDNGGFSRGLGGLLAAGLGAYGSNQQAKSLMDIANQARGDRQPFLNAALGYLGNPDSYFAGPGKSAMDATLRGLSASVGNPIGSPTAMGIATEAGLRDWRNAVTGFGNIGLAGQDLRAQLQSNAAQADANGLNALGYGLNTVLNPQPNITDIVKAMNLGGLA